MIISGCPSGFFLTINLLVPDNSIPTFSYPIQTKKPVKNETLLYSGCYRVICNTNLHLFSLFFRFREQTIDIIGGGHGHHFQCEVKLFKNIWHSIMRVYIREFVSEQKWYLKLKKRKYQTILKPSYQPPQTPFPALTLLSSGCCLMHDMVCNDVL